MISRKVFIFLMAILLICPAYAYDDGLVTAHEPVLNKWLLNVTLYDDGLVEDIIQAEINDSDSFHIDGFSFKIPGSDIKMYNFTHTTNAGIGKQQNVPGGKELIIDFNKSTTGKWDGGIGFTAENWTIKENSNYSINIPIEMPVIIADQNIKSNMLIPSDADIRAQILLPKSIDVTFVAPKPSRILPQQDKIVLTWDKLRINDAIIINWKVKGTAKII